MLELYEDVNHLLPISRLDNQCLISTRKIRQRIRAFLREARMMKQENVNALDRQLNLEEW